jgi:hypothetical protein
MGEILERYVSMCFVLCLLTIMMATASASFVESATLEENMNGSTNGAAERTVTLTVRDRSVLSDISGIDVNSRNRVGENGGEYEVTLVRNDGLEDLEPPDYANGASVDDDPSPMGSIDPEPMDAPFLPNDVLVYNDAANSERNVDLAKSTNEDLYAVYDHDIGSGVRDVYVSKSTDGGLTWAKRNVAVAVGDDEYCPSIASDYSPRVGTELMLVWYNKPTLEFGYSQDGDTWSTNDLGGGITWWDNVNCPYVEVLGDFMIVISEYYDSSNAIDTWQIIYTLDGLSWETYHVNMWADAWAYRPRVTIMDSNEVYIAMDIYDKSDSNPANWWHDTLMFGMLLTGNLVNDDFSSISWGSLYDNQISTSPDIDSDGFNLNFAMEVYDPLAIPLSTSSIWCAKADITRYDEDLSWYGCYNDGWYFAFDPSDMKNQKYPMLYRDVNTVHLAWLNGSDINYRVSADGGGNWTGSPYKVNAPGSSTAINVWHSPDVVERGGRACVAWHDSRGSDNIYFQTFQNNRMFGIHTIAGIPQLQVREVGDSWHSSPHFYMWPDGSSHDVEALSSFEIPTDTRYTFNQWDDGSLLNPTTVTVSALNVEITAQYDRLFWLDMQTSGGTTTPASSWQTEGALVTIEAFPPANPPGGQYVFAGWTGDITDSRNPCTSCVLMDMPRTVLANWQLQWEVTIDTNPTGLTIQVDGINHTAPYNAWLNDSQPHNIGAPSPQNAGPTIQYTWIQWSDVGSQFHDVVVTASGTTFTALFRTEYFMTLDTNPSGLEVLLSAVQFTAPHSFWCLELSKPWIEAPSPQYLGVSGERYVWKDWSDGGIQTHQHTCVAAQTVTANFGLERSMNITTNPGGFNVIVDGLPYATPMQFWWDDASNHTVEALTSIPVGANNRYNFSDWSDSGARIHDIWANTSDQLITANYVFQHKLTIQANYPGLSILFDSSPMPLPYVVWCDDGSTHLVDAPSLQGTGDSRYMFDSWSDGGAQTHVIPCDAPNILQVNYELGYKLYVNSTLDGVPSTLDVIIGGVPYTTPAEVWWPADTLMALDAFEFQPGVNPITGIRFMFVDWMDSGIKNRTVIINAPGLSFVANFVTQHRLTFVDPHGTPMTLPAGYPVVDGTYFDKGTTVDIQTDSLVLDVADHRWRFDAWTSSDPGGYTGPNNPASVTMTGPITQTVSWFDQYMLTIVSAYGSPSAGGWVEQQSASQFWYDFGDSAFFWIETSVLISASERAFFNSWSGGTNGTVMSGALTVTANWDLEFLVTVTSSHGTVPPPVWIEDGATCPLTIEEYILAGNSRYRFSGWTTVDTANGGYDGPVREPTLTVTGPINETAIWDSEYLVTVITSHGTAPSPAWVMEGEFYSLQVEEYELVGDTRHHFSGWTTPDTANGGYQGPDRLTTLLVYGPITETAIWETQHLLTILSDYGLPTATGWEDQQSPSAFWYIEGNSASFWIPPEVFLTAGQDSKAVFESWSGAMNGTTMNSPVTVRAAWHLEYLVVIESIHGTTPPDTWVRDGQSHQISMDEVVDHPTNADIRYKFSSWSSININVGGYAGTNRVQLLTVAGPIVETAAWIAQYRLRIASQYEDEPGIIGVPRGEGWHDEGTVATIEVAGSETIGEWRYKFERWIGSVVNSGDNKTTVIVNEPISLGVEWSKSKETGLFEDIWWVLVIIIVIIAAVISVAVLLKRRKPAEEVPETVKEESSIEEISKETGSAESIEESED